MAFLMEKAETATRGVLWKELFLRISQYSRKTLLSFAGISLLKRDSNTGVFSFDYYDIFNNTYFQEHMRMAPSDKAYST